ncbi:MAG: hypothetical protein DRI37_10315 [Chloroflexi bacterium]|nr:MAG: hypothetical protein DRI37_10315 [Chloroflexota bacterium]
MQNHARLFKITVRTKLILTHLAVALIVLFVARWTVWGAILAGLLLSLWAAQPLARRVGRALQVSRAWLRGNLAVRIADPGRDDLGALAETLDLLAEQLGEDEQDLAALRERNARFTDQVRALALVEERNRLARELHDSVKQYLFSVAMTAGAIRTRCDALQSIPADLLEMVREVETAAQTAQRETTRLIADLRPCSLQEQGLAAALSDYALLFGAREHVLVYQDVQGDTGHLPLPVAEALYRVAQEALHNVAHHARATRVDVQLRCLPEQVALLIRDNGVGFDTTASHRGLGLTNMQERIMALGGCLTVESEAGNGTTVLAEVGVSSPGSAPADVNKPAYRPPASEDWAWLGRNLMIPVGQVWPWLPADQRQLRRPLLEPAALTLRKTTGLWGLKQCYVLEREGVPLARVRHGRTRDRWNMEGAAWTLRRLRGGGGRAVLLRNRQPLAAMQYQGRRMDTWSEIVYDGHGYRLAYLKEPRTFVLVDEKEEEILRITGGAVFPIVLQRPLPLPLIIMVAARVAEELAVTAGS